MIEMFIEGWEKRKNLLQERIAKTPQSEYSDYEALVKILLEEIINPCLPADKGFDAEKIHVIDDSCYQGVQLFIVPELHDEPCEYFLTSVFYGSCSVCDTLMSISDEEDGLPT